jgi:hypothetical protein
VQEGLRSGAKAVCEGYRLAVQWITRTGPMETSPESESKVAALADYSARKSDIGPTFELSQEVERQPSITDFVQFCNTLEFCKLLIRQLLVGVLRNLLLT